MAKSMICDMLNFPGDFDLREEAFHYPMLFFSSSSSSGGGGSKNSDSSNSSSSSSDSSISDSSISSSSSSDSSNSSTSSSDSSNSSTSSSDSSNSSSSSSDSSISDSSISSSSSSSSSSPSSGAPSSGGGKGDGKGDKEQEILLSSEFMELEAEIRKRTIDAKVSFNEARQFRSLYTVGNYLLADVPDSMPILMNDIGGEDNLSRILFSGLSTDDHKMLDKIIEDITKLNTNDEKSKERVLSDVRAQFDLGTGVVDNVNTEFKTLYRELVGLFTDELLSVEETKKDLEAKASWDVKKTEELHSYLKRTLRLTNRLTRNMSDAGTMATKFRVDSWSKPLAESIKMLFTAAEKVNSSDQDDKHGWALLARLNQVDRDDIRSYLVQAKEGGKLLGYVIDLADELQKKKDEPNFEDDLDNIMQFLKNKVENKFDGKSPRKAITSIANSVYENMPREWGS